jgi:predicted DNA-binding transcriptional regulator AlpA
MTKVRVTGDTPPRLCVTPNQQVRGPNDADDAGDAEIRTSDTRDPLPFALPAELSEGVPALARPKMLKLHEVLEEIEMSRAAFYRMRARGKAPKLIKLPNGHIRCRRSDLDAWWATHEIAA